MHEHDRRVAIAFRQCFRKPRFAFGADDPAVLPGNHRVECDEPHRIIVDDVLQEIGMLVQIPMAIAEAFAHHVAPVVVAGDHERGHRQRRKHCVDLAVFGGKTAIGEIAGREHAIGCRIECCDGRDGPPQHRVGVDAAIRHHAPRAHVEIGDLGDDHRRTRCGWQSSAARTEARHFISAAVSFCSRSNPAFGSISPRMTPVMISRCARHVRTELPPG